MVKLTLPSFTGLPTDDVEKVDVYGEVANDVKNKIASNITAFGTSTQELIDKSVGSLKKTGDSLGLKSKIAKIKELGKDADSKLGKAKQLYERAREIEVNVNDVRHRVQGALKGNRGAILGLASDFDQLIMGELAGTDGITGYITTATDFYDGVKVGIGTVDHYFRDGNIRGVNDVLNFIGDMSGNSLLEVFDLGATAALMKGMISKVSGWGIADLIDETIGAKWNDKFNRYDYDYNDEFRFSVVKRTSESLTPGTSLDIIERLILHGGDKALIAANPDFPIQLISGYVFPESIVPGEAQEGVITYEEQLGRMVRILDILKSDWLKVNRGNDSVFNLYFLSHASEDAATLFKSSELYQEPMMIAPLYTVESGKELILRLYPEAIV